MARTRPAIVFLIASVALTSSAAAQVVDLSPQAYASDIGARGITAADFNRDGWIDTAQANGTRNSVTIALNRAGSGLGRRIEIPAGAGPFDLAAADLNRDGVPDLAVANADGNSISILLGRGDGSFTRADVAAASQNPRGIAIADVNNDGRPDVIYTGYATGTVQVLLGNGAGAFVKGPTYTAAGSRPQGIASGDFNHDGFLDLAVACNDAIGLRILYGSRAGTFVARSIAGPGNLNVLSVGDLNGDGWLDIVAASTGSSEAAVFLAGASTVTYARSYVVGASPRGIALGDLNGDGGLDVITANRSSSTVSVLVSDRAHPGAFFADQEFASSSGSRAIATADFDGDGRLDVAAGNEYAAAVTVLSNVTPMRRAGFTFGALTLANAQPLGAEDDSFDSRFLPTPQIAVADFNRDGKLDFVVPGAPLSAPSYVIVMLRDGPTVTLTGPGPLTRFLVADFNADGNPDILYYSSDRDARSTPTRFVAYLGDGAGHFTQSPRTTQPQSLAWCAAGDLNRDGRPDLVCDNLILIGNGDGTFATAVAYATEGTNSDFPGPLLADLNRDGKLDVVGSGFGDGNGGVTSGDGASVPPALVNGVVAVADLNHDGYPDLVARDPPDRLIVDFGSADGFGEPQFYPVLEDYSLPVVADVNLDGHPDIVVNASADPESAGTVSILFGNAAGTFDTQYFVLPPGRVAVADVTRHGLPDIVAYDAHGVHVLVNERNDMNHPPVVPSYSRTSGNPCVVLDARASDPDQHTLTVAWYDQAGALVGTTFGVQTGLEVCVTTPGTYKYRRTATDGRGGSTTGTVTFTYEATMKEIVLYAAASNVSMTGNWSRASDSTAAGGFRAHDANLGAPKVTTPSADPANAITIPFVADPNLTYKLWIRLKADGNSWANDSVWVQFSTAATAPYTTGTTAGLAVSLEECVNCGVSGWGWQDDGYGAPNTNGMLLHFDAGPHTIVIQTREDGVSIDQIVLSAEKYLTVRPGAAKDDRTILPQTPQ